MGGEVGEQAVERVVGVPAAVRAAGTGVDVGPDQAGHGGEADFVGSMPAWAATRAASVAIVLCTSRDAPTSWRARASDWPRRTRPLSVGVVLAQYAAADQGVFIDLPRRLHLPPARAIRR